MSSLNDFLGEAPQPAEPEAPPTDETPAALEPAGEELNPDGGVPPAEPEAPPPGGDRRDEAIWREERARRKELQAQVEQMNTRWQQMIERMQTPPAAAPAAPPAEGTPDIQIPDFDDDPIGHLRAKNELLERKLADVDKDRSLATEQRARMTQFQQLRDGVDQVETEFAEKTPDYRDAVGYLYANVDRMAQAMGYNPQQRQQTVSQVAMDLAVRALRSGQNPAEAAYQAAKQLGWGSAPPAANEQHARRAPPTSLASVPARQADAGVPSWDSISHMDDQEFDVFWGKFAKGKL